MADRTTENGTRRRVITIIQIAVVVITLGAVALFYFTRYDRVNRANLEAFLRDFGMWAPLAYAVIYIACAPIPFLAPILTGIGGLIFGVWRGTLYTLVVATISALVPFSLARRLGRDWVESKLKGKRLDEIYQQSAGSKGFTFILLLRLIPLLPWEIQNYVAGLTKVSVPTYMLATVLGIIPGSFSLAFLGSAITDPMSWEFYAAIALKIATALVPVVATYVRSRRKKGQAGQTESGKKQLT